MQATGKRRGAVEARRRSHAARCAGGFRQYRPARARTIKDLRSDTRALVEGAVRLPSIDQPELGLQLFCREDLNAQPIEEPWRVRRHIRWLVSPVVKVVVAEQPDVRHEDPGIHVDAVQHIEVISAIGFGKVAVGVGQIPLAAPGAGIIARSRLGVQPELRHHPRANVVVMEIAADA